MIEFRNVTKAYPGTTPAAERPAVQDFSLQVDSGSLTVFVGTSGCGKTTLLRMVNRMIEPTSGQVLVGGRDVAEQDAVTLRRSIGYVIQSGGLLPHRTVADNVATVPVLQGVPKRQARKQVPALLERVGLDPALASRYPEQLSGGQQQRVGVARALAGDPDVLLMDEPFSAVDPIVRRELQEEFLKLQQQLHKTILFVTHDVDEALLLGDQVVVLAEGGKIVQQGSPQELVARPASEFVASFLGNSASSRQLRVIERAGKRLVVNERGVPLGLLD